MEYPSISKSKVCNVRDGIVARSVISPGLLYFFVFIKRWRNYGLGDYTVTHVIHDIGLPNNVYYMGLCTV